MPDLQTDQHTLKAPVVIIGIGEMGGVFARGFLRNGHAVYPVTRTTDMEAASRQIPAPQLVLLAVAENDLHAALQDIPAIWHSRLALLQNELLPDDWLRHGYNNATVISVWFEKKKGQDAKVLLPSPAFGSGAKLLKDALESIDIPVHVVASEDQLLYELVRKNLYILTTNIAGLETGGSVAELWSQHQDVAREVAGEILRIEEKLTGKSLDREALIDGMVEAFNADPEHKCMGRSAPARLQRALETASSFNLALEKLPQIAARQAS